MGNIKPIRLWNKDKDDETKVKKPATLSGVEPIRLWGGASNGKPKIPTTSREDQITKIQTEKPWLKPEPLSENIPPGGIDPHLFLRLREQGRTKEDIMKDLIPDKQTLDAPLLKAYGQVKSAFGGMIEWAEHKRGKDRDIDEALKQRLIENEDYKTLEELNALKKLEGLGGRMKKSGEELIEEGTDYKKLDKLGDFDYGDFLNPDFYTQKVLPASGIIASLVPLAIVGGYAGAGVAGALGLGAFGTLVLGSIGAAGLSRPLESAMEGADTFNEAKRRGMTDEEANKAGNAVFKKNLSLAGLDAIELALAFAPGKGAIKTSGKLIFSGGLEMFEEQFFQYRFQKEALGEEVDMFSPEAKEAGAIGLFYGVGVGSVGSTFNYLNQKSYQGYNDNNKQKLDDAVKTGDPKVIREALNEIAETPNGKEAIETASKSTKKILDKIDSEVKQAVPAEQKQAATTDTTSIENYIDNKDAKFRTDKPIPVNENKIKQIEVQRQALLDQKQSLMTEKGLKETHPTIKNIIKSMQTLEQEAFDLRTPKYRVAEEAESERLTTVILKDLEGKESVSKQYISDATNRGNIKQVERDLIRDILKTEGDKVNVAEFTKKVQAELLPLELQNSRDNAWMDQKWEGPATLPDDIRGNVANYEEHIYNSPIMTSAGDIHFQGQTSNYFGHTRVEDMENGIRRIIEDQTDLYQKGELERESKEAGYAYEETSGQPKDDYVDFVFEKTGKDLSDISVQEEFIDSPLESKIKKEFIKINSKTKLKQYNNPFAHFRMFREEIRGAALDGVKKVQIPTGETAMKIEGLGDSTQWFSNVVRDNDYDIDPTRSDLLKQGDLKVGKVINQSGNQSWVITDVLGDGKFKAVPKNVWDNTRPEGMTIIKDKTTGGEEIYLVKNNKTGEVLKPSGKKTRARAKEFINEWSKDSYKNYIEEFDISGKIDKKNPIYRFYEKTMGRYAVKKYGAKRVTDNKGVEWYEIDIKPEHRQPVEAFRIKTDLAKKGIEITDAQEIEIKALNKKIFGDDNLKIISQILANKDALGYYEKGIIKILKGQVDPKDTFYHEAVHKYLDVFTDRAEHIAILKEGQKVYGIQDLVQVEERIAEDFIKFAKNGEAASSKLKTYFTRILSRVRKYFGNKSKIDSLYEKIIAGQEQVTKEEPIVLDQASPPSEDSVKAVMKALKEAKPVRKEQELIYTKERAEKITRAKAIAKDTPGEAGFHAELAALKGEMTKAQFEDIRGQVSQADISTDDIIALGILKNW